MHHASITRTHTGTMILKASGVQVQGANVVSIGNNGEHLVAVVHIPLTSCSFSEQDNVVPMVRKRAA